MVKSKFILKILVQANGQFFLMLWKDRNGKYTYKTIDCQFFGWVKVLSN